MQSAQLWCVTPTSVEQLCVTYCTTDTRLPRGGERRTHYQTEESQMIFKL